MMPFTSKCEQKSRTKLQREKIEKKFWGIFTGQNCDQNFKLTVCAGAHRAQEIPLSTNCGP
jgi:hypothetical protein